MRKVATDKKAPLMELHERAVDLYLKVGRKVSETWGLPKPDPTNPKITILDKTHFNDEGSAAMGKVVADELRRVVPELASISNNYPRSRARCRQFSLFRSRLLVLPRGVS